MRKVALKGCVHMRACKIQEHVPEAIEGEQSFARLQPNSWSEALGHRRLVLLVRLLTTSCVGDSAGGSSAASVGPCGEGLCSRGTGQVSNSSRSSFEFGKQSFELRSSFQLRPKFPTQTQVSNSTSPPAADSSVGEGGFGTPRIRVPPWGSN